MVKKHVSKPRPKPRLKKEETLLGNYLGEHKVLIADTTAEVRSGIAKILHGMGAQSSQIFLAADYERAVFFLKEERPDLIICEFHIGHRRGLDLIQYLPRGPWQSRKSIFMMVTSDKTESSVAEAAEEEVDGYILKPYSLQGFKDHLVRAYLSKVDPDSYRRTIEEGKLTLGFRDIEEAKQTFLRAVKLSRRPALAYYYYGRACLMQKNIAEAEEAYQTGLKYDLRHYKCLNGLLDLYLRQKRSKDAYKIARRLISVYPISSARLNSIVRLAIHNHMFEDVDAYFEAYSQMDRRPVELTRCMVAAQIVAGKFYFKQDDLPSAYRLFDGAIKASLRAPSTLAQILNTLLEQGDFARAEHYLRLFPTDKRSGEIYKLLNFLVLDYKGSAQEVILQGRKIIKAGIYDPRVYEIMIRRSVEVKLSRWVDAFLEEALSRWPEMSERFTRWIQKAPPSPP